LYNKNYTVDLCICDLIGNNAEKFIKMCAAVKKIFEKYNLKIISNTEKKSSTMSIDYDIKSVHKFPIIYKYNISIIATEIVRLIIFSLNTFMDMDMNIGMDMV
jgi:hypothetical protein